MVNQRQTSIEADDLIRLFWILREGFLTNRDSGIVCDCEF